MNEKKSGMKSGRIIVAVVMLASLLLGVIAPAKAATVLLQWDPNTESDLAGYKAYYAAGSFVGPLMVDVGNQTSTTITDLDPASSYSFAVTAYNKVGLESGYSNVVVVNEQLPPVTSITYPASGTTISGSVNVTATASDNVAVSKVEFYLNGTLVASDVTSPYVYTWDTLVSAPGSHVLLAKAYDGNGNIGQSSLVNVTTVNDQTAPTVSIASPATGSTISGSVNITATASDNVEVSMVEFYINGMLRAAWSAAPFTYNWNTILEENGTYTLSAKAYDAAGNLTTAQPVSVQVNNAPVDTQAPVVSVTTVWATPSTSLTLTGSATDNVGVSSVLVKVGTRVPVAATLNGSTWSCPVSSLAIGNTTVVVTAKDTNGNTANTTTTVTVYRRGDVNGDGVVDIKDAQLAQKMAVGKMRATAEQTLRGDVAPLVNSVPQPNGVIDTGDVIVIQNIVVGNVIL